MTRDEIIRMAREAGFPFNKYGALKGDEDGEIDADEMFERFAALVAAAEREECAKTVEKHKGEKIGTWPVAFSPATIAKAIRARGGVTN